ncbi:MAG: hemerythrin family protein [Ruminococcus sp.]|jgi:hemerythrin|nr:hemerythrin family protein [Ruminococcus sp.]
MYTFTKDLETGNNLIDTEHRQLFQAINGLLEACNAGQGRANVEKTVKFLMEYTAKHFADEEKLQQASKYPDYPNHYKIHEGFKKRVAEIGAELNAKGPSIILVSKVNSDIGDWLINHIRTQDKKLAEHIKTHS